MRVRPTPDRQTTLRRPVSLSGRGVHRDEAVRLTLHPAEAGAGLSFLRVAGATEITIPALWTNVVATRLATSLAHSDDPDLAIRGVEHVLAALRGCGVDNAVVEIDGGEAPILDGSARPFVDAIRSVGLRTLADPRSPIEVLKPVRVDAGASFAELRPSDRPGLSLDIGIDYRDVAVGRQSCALALDRRSFGRIAAARTFGFTADAEALWREDFARGSSLENTVVVADGRVLNEGGLRFPDEFVRHKALDAVGDLALAGAPLQAQFRSHRGGHALNIAVLRALFADATAWRCIPATTGAGGARRAEPPAVAALPR